MKKIVFVLLMIGILGTLFACSAGKEPEVTEQMHAQISQTVLEKEYYDYGYEAHEVLYAAAGDLNGKHTEQYLTVYVYTLFGDYSLKNGKAVMRSGGSNPAAVVLEKSEGEYRVKEYWSPRDGAYYTEDLKETFPAPAYEALQKIDETALSHNELMAQLESEIAAQLKENAG